MSSPYEKTLSVEEYLQGKGQVSLGLSDLRLLYKALDKPEARIVIDGEMVYVSLKPNPSVSIKVIIKNKEDLSFFEEKIIVDIKEKVDGPAFFFLKELWQPRIKFRKNFQRLMIFILFPLTLNFWIFKELENTYLLKEGFEGILTAITIFIAIFTLFTVNHDYMDRKRSDLFVNGKLPYLFAVDRNLAILGIVCLLAALAGLILTSSEPVTSCAARSLCSKNTQLAVLVFFNISLVLLMILLRSIIEFYIHRPARFILGDLKEKFLKDYERKE